MLFKAYPTYIYFLNDIFCSTTYYTRQQIFFNNIYMFLNNMRMSYNIIGHTYVMHRFTTYIWSLCNMFLHLPAGITPIVALSADQSVVQWACQFIVSSKHFNCTISNLFFQRDDIFYLLPVYSCLKGVALAQHSEATLTPRVIHMFESVCVRGEWDRYSLSRGQTHCPCLNTAVWLPTRVPAYCGHLDYPTASWWVGCHLLPRSLHSRCPLTLPWTHGQSIAWEMCCKGQIWYLTFEPAYIISKLHSWLNPTQSKSGCIEPYCISFYATHCTAYLSSHSISKHTASHDTTEQINKLVTYMTQVSKQRN